MTDEKTKDVKEAAEIKEAAEEVKEAAEEVVEAAKGTKDEKAEEIAKEAVESAEKAEEKAEEAVKEIKTEKAETIQKAEPSGKFKNIIKDIESLSALELAELVKALEERFGVSAAAPVAVAGTAVPAAGGAEAAEEKSQWTVVLANGGSNKIGAIKAIREVLPNLGLVEAKEMVEGAPKTVKENVPTEEANSIKEKLEAAGATVELK